MSSASPPISATPTAVDGARRERGFTLLEVLCAFAILAGLSGVIVQLWFSAMERGSEAVELRELREAADTVFRRLLYEDGKHADGLTTTLDSFYLDWAHINAPRSRWEIYGMEYHRRARTAAGEDTTDATGLFEGGGRPGSSSSGSSGSGTPAGSTTPGTTGSSPGSSFAGGDEEDTGVTLYQITLRIYLVTDPDKDLITLQTYLPSTQETTGTGTGTSSGTSGTSGTGR